jgi:hypothetical protein
VPEKRYHAPWNIFDQARPGGGRAGPRLIEDDVAPRAMLFSVHRRRFCPAAPHSPDQQQHYRNETSSKDRQPVEHVDIAMMAARDSITWPM